MSTDDREQDRVTQAEIAAWIIHASGSCVACRGAPRGLCWECELGDGDE